MNILQCSHCQDIAIDLFQHTHSKYCCGEAMAVLAPNRYPEFQDEHAIQVRKIGHFVTVTIGKEAHPMVDIHRIAWVLLETNQGFQFKTLKAGDQPIVDFLVDDEQEDVLNVYAYCTAHALWSYNKAIEGLDR